MKKKLLSGFLLAYVLFLVVSLGTDFQPGKEIGANFLSFALSMLKILPGAFVLIGLFQVWVSRERVEKHLGDDSSFAGFLWVFLLAGTTVGGLYVAFPVAWALYEKGARLQVVLAYVGFAALCRVPMTIFEVSFMGLKFTLVRLLVSIPLVVISSELFGRYLRNRNWQMHSPE